MSTRARTGWSILVADAQTLVREGVKALVRDILGAVEFVEVADGDALARSLAAHPDVRLALIDPRMPAMHGGARLMDLVRAHPGVPLVLLVGSLEGVRRMRSLDAIFALVSKDTDAAGLRIAIEAALDGRKLALASVRGGGDPRPLTPRQEEIRQLLRQGMTNKVIASTLGISAGTVKNHITGIFRALNATNRTQAAQLNEEPD